MAEIFAVGDAVAYQEGTSVEAMQCRVVKVMPVERSGRFYRIRDARENFDRSVPGYTLTRVVGGLASETFGPVKTPV